jgi:hypothetical protein
MGGLLHRLVYGHWPQWRSVALYGNMLDAWTEQRCTTCGRRRTVAAAER